VTERALNVGLLVPANNTTMERELCHWLPAGSTCVRIGIPRGHGLLRPEDLPAYLAHTVTLARAFRDDAIDRIAYGCTAAGFMAGPARDREVAAQIEQVTGKPVCTTASAMVSVLDHIRARNVAVITPYLDLVNERLTSYLEQSGIRVDVLESFRAPDVDALAAITPRQIAQLARETMKHRECDALFIGCSQLPTLELCGPLEAELGRPVWSSIRATAWEIGRRVQEPSLSQ
jgi:maleate cis-trans isomerase